MKKKIAILHNRISSGSPDELDVLSQRDLVKTSLIKLGYKVSCHETGNDPMDVATSIWMENSELVFNLVESVWDKDELIYVMPAILNSMRIPYTGVSLESLFITTNKILTKQMLTLAGIKTPDHYRIDMINALKPNRQYFFKPIWGDASVGIINEPVFTTADRKMVKDLSSWSSKHYFIEEYIDGREFNVAMLAGSKGPEILPIAEMVFKEFYHDKPKVLGYRAKWIADSDEYKNTDRAFDTLDAEPEIEATIRNISMDVWKLFDLKGYVRIDFRVDRSGQVFVIEVNGNPCISPDSGFVAAALRGGYNIETMIKRIVINAT